MKRWKCNMQTNRQKMDMLIRDKTKQLLKTK